jgi:hypothetical protein
VPTISPTEPAETQPQPTKHTHDYSKTAVDSTCTEKGYTKYTCSCGDSYTASYKDPLGHNYKVTVVEPTVNQRGYTLHECKRCGYSYKDTYVAAIGHSYGGWTQVKAPDCTAVGQEQRTCKTCKETETRDITPNGHSYEAVTTPPTCTEDGYTTNTCSVCGDTYQDTYVDQLGHEYEDGICIRCGESEIVLGDVNGDGSIDTTDAYYIVLYYNEKMDLSAEQLLAADVNGDGAVDTTDAYYIVLFYNEKIDQFPS